MVGMIGSVVRERRRGRSGWIGELGEGENKGHRLMDWGVR